MARDTTLGTFQGGRPYRWPDGRVIAMPGAAVSQKRRSLAILLVLLWLYNEGRL